MSASRSGSSTRTTSSPTSARRWMRRSELSFPWPTDLGLTVASHGWVHLAPWTWEPETGTLSHAERIGARTGRIAARQLDSTTLTLDAEGFAVEDGPEILRRVARWVSGDW